MKSQEYNRIDSRIIIKIVNKATGLAPSKICKQIGLSETNTKSRFIKGYQNTQKSYWPEQSTWFIRYLTDNCIPLDRLLVEDQKFPLSLNDFDSVNNLVKYVSEDKRKYAPNIYNRERLRKQKTIDSVIFEYICHQLTENLHTFDAAKACVLDVCRENGVHPKEIEHISKMNAHNHSIESLSVYLVIKGKQAKGNPWIMSYDSEDIIDECWKILTSEETKNDPMQLSARIMENDKALYEQLPESCLGSQRQWADVFSAFPNFCKFLVDPQGEVQGNFSSVGLSRTQEKRIQQGRLKDSEIDVVDCDPLQMPGEHVLYLLNLSVNHGVQIEKYYQLWDSLIELIKEYARKGIYFSRIYYKAFIPEHRAMVIGRGFRFVCEDIEFGSVFVHAMDPNSTLRILDEELATLYREQKQQNRVSRKVTSNELEAEVGFQNLFRMMDDLFRNPRLLELKPYFFGDTELPDDENMRQLGIATGELLRDILQYSDYLLEYLPEEFERTYRDYAEQIMESGLVKASMEQYRFSTEYPDFQIKKLGIDMVNTRDIVTFALIWIELDKLFLRDEILKLRPYFYERSNCLPSEEEMPIATALVVRLLSAMKISESLLDRIPHHFVSSYYKYKQMIKSVRLVEEVVSTNHFLKDELKW